MSMNPLGMFGPRTGHPALFNDLCRLHGLDRPTRRLLQAVTDKPPSDRPALIFVDPAWMHRALDESDFRESAAELRRLYDAWFGADKSAFQEKTIRHLGKSPDPAAADILFFVLDRPEDDLRSLAFDMLYRRKEPEIDIRLFDRFARNEDAWTTSKFLTPERLARLADAAFRSDRAQRRDRAAEVIVRHKLYETLPAVLHDLEGSDESRSRQTRDMLRRLADAFYADLVEAPSETERRNLDRRRDWFVQQLDGPVKRYAVHGIDEVLEALLIVTKKDYPTMRTVMGDYRSAACGKIADLLEFGDHGSYMRVLLGYVGDPNSPGIVDEILSRRSDTAFVRALLTMVGDNPQRELRECLKRFKDFAWLRPDDPGLAEKIEDLEPHAVRLVQASSIPKDKALSLYRFFLTLPSSEARRTTVDVLRRLVGDDVDALLLDFFDDPDPVTCALIFRTLKAHNAKELDRCFLRIVERPEEDIRLALYETMPELHIESFASRIGQMTPQSAKTLGRFVRMVDSNTSKVIADDLASPIPIRRLSACGVAAATGFASDFAERLIELAEGDDEVNVRVAAVSALGTVLRKDAVETVKALLNDRSMDVRDAATVALKQWLTAYSGDAVPGS